MTTPWKALIAILPLAAFTSLPPLVSQTSVPSPQAPTALNYEVLTPPTASTPSIHGPKLFGVRPGVVFLYTIPATGDRPMTYSASGLPPGLMLDPSTARITGTVVKPGVYVVTLHAKNKLGKTERPFRIVVGKKIGLTPAMGWNNYNIWGTDTTTKHTLDAAHAMVDSGLAQHGYTYINMDDGWQGTRSSPLNALQPDPKRFEDMKGLADQVHALGLKMGIYHTPWVTSYGNRVGASSENPDGTWDRATMTKGPKNQKHLPFAIGKYHFVKQDAQQFADWGIDYLKYDWGPVEAPETKEMHEALRATGRDIVFSLSNNAAGNLIHDIDDVSPWANSWRISNDIDDSWNSILHNGFGQDQWARYSQPGHFNDPDMLSVGIVGFGKSPHPSRLTPDEQYSHVSLWCLMASPLLLGNDLTKLDAFTLRLLTNDEVLDIDQDSLGLQATQVFKNSKPEGDLHIYAKRLEDESWAVGLFNLGEETNTISLKWSYLKLKGRQTVRDLWRQRDLGTMDDEFHTTVSPHGVVLVRLSNASNGNSR